MAELFTLVPETSIKPTVLTYCYHKQMVYVQAAETFEQAVDFALDVFPDLKSVDRSAITLEIRVLVGKTKQSVRVGANAWSTLLIKLTEYEVMDIRVALPDMPPSYYAPEAHPSHLEPCGVASHRHARLPSPLAKIANFFTGSRSSSEKRDSSRDSWDDPPSSKTCCF
ncbi:hypothetical protein EVG20_g5593 [Dentipellis fragilis]|uniref:Uncharacterized protein n=1 Tax=Dentipellis fragilis TaxID=205917 RepID=A0A4Y9YUM4_9AGAM|nr:hypothetical protein EVG20_g5593 [Dentipellis fragilis]